MRAMFRTFFFAFVVTVVNFVFR
ncbi:uncharacterized protein METZ01_LOCUS160448 [marine metagenome]|uniref:Uncharacterized protein n=1 Tax=marine metagenome TaxID=408172 RepID=A0A382B1X3_9ZZZZ